MSSDMLALNSGSVANSPIAARRLLGTARLPRWSRSASDRSDGSTGSGWPGSLDWAMPSRPAALISMFIVSASRPQNGEAARTAAWRLSYPQQVYAVDQERATSRRYELTL